MTFDLRAAHAICDKLASGKDAIDIDAWLYFVLANAHLSGAEIEEKYQEWLEGKI